MDFLKTLVDLSQIASGLGTVAAVVVAVRALNSANGMNRDLMKQNKEMALRNESLVKLQVRAPQNSELRLVINEIEKETESLLGRCRLMGCRLRQNLEACAYRVIGRQDNDWQGDLMFRAASAAVISAFRMRTFRAQNECTHHHFIQLWWKVSDFFDVKGRESCIRHFATRPEVIECVMQLRATLQDWSVRRRLEEELQKVPKDATTLGEIEGEAERLVSRLDDVVVLLNGGLRELHRTLGEVTKSDYNEEKSLLNKAILMRLVLRRRINIANDGRPYFGSSASLLRPFVFAALLENASLNEDQFDSSLVMDEP